MMKVIGLVLGIIVTIYSAAFLFFILPQMQTLYNQMGIAANQDMYLQVKLYLLLSLGLANIAAWVLFGKDQTYSQIFVILFVITAILFVYINATVIPEVIGPIYNLTSQIQ